MARRNRSPGTGSISSARGKFYAFAPPDENGIRKRIGEAHGSRFQAERELEKWLREHGQGEGVSS